MSELHHQNPCSSYSPSPSTIWIASFDIGKKNFAFCIEEVNISGFDEIENISAGSRYYKDGTCTIAFRNIIKDVCLNGKIIILENINLCEGCDDKQYLDPKIFVNMTKLLDSYKRYWAQCTTFVIEQQMGFGKKRNTMALKLGQHCFSYFIFQFSSFKMPIEFPAFYKTKILGAPKKMSKYDRKLWSVNQAIDILMARGDTQSLEKLSSRKKRDDLSDVITQLQAFKYMVFVDKSL